MNAPAAGSNRAALILTLLIQVGLAIGLIPYVARRDWENVFLTFAVITLTLLPAFALRRLRVHVPMEFQFIAALFVFLSLFLGSAGDFYYRYWWWDMALHATSGVLLGIVGWIVLFLLIHSDRLPRGVSPGLICLFGLTFAVFLGVLWEIFEFAVDSTWPHVNMMSNETGVSDTMKDLIGNLAGAAVVAILGWAHARTGRFLFLVDAVRAFTRRNPRLFRKKRSPAA